MKLRKIHIKNFRSIHDVEIEVHNYTMLVGANNAGKSNIMAALRAFYEDVVWTKDDEPKFNSSVLENEIEVESWVELKFELTDNEWNALADKYKGTKEKHLTVRKYFISKEKVKPRQSNIYGIVDGVIDESLFYGAKNIGSAKLGQIIYIPAFISASEQMKTSGASPLRDMLNLMLKKALVNSPAYQKVITSFDEFNDEAKNKNGFLDQIANPINSAISSWGIKFDMSIGAISPEDITKNLIRHSFVDSMLGDYALSLDRYGHGFQRSFLYELIKLVPEISNENNTTQEKNDFNPDFTLILFEEPEAFLHPTQQENMAYHLRRLGEGNEQQVIITSHSPIFVGKATDSLCQIGRVHKKDGLTSLGQIKLEELGNIFSSGLDFKICLQNFVNNANIPDDRKKTAKELLKNSEQNNEIEIQNEKFRYQLWLDSERSSMFFADKVLLVEGPTEKALFNWLLANNHDWHTFTKHRIAVVDVIGKFNFHRYMTLLDIFGIPYGLILDDDLNKNHHQAINDMLKNYDCNCKIAEPVFIPQCIESYLGLNLPSRADLKPLEILKKLENNEINADKLNDLKRKFMLALDLG
ncbi:AAA family ATPase [Glaesserella parasuis]|uniref:ATP-dependent nuclease n=1 Tax=Glaesserella parasuis TaxID=738 RepID=UPI0024371FF0|nr:AAA family ATPase [Glaesserella parasuis]MDG6293005.1 AAA family ATPase [Glaesserella parasuis]